MSCRAMQRQRKRISTEQVKEVARNMVKRCANTAMMNTFIAIIEPPGLNGNLRTIWHTICAGRLTCVLEDFVSILYNDEPWMQAGNGVSQFDLRHYNLRNFLVSRQGSREEMDEMWTSELLLQDTVIESN